MDQADCVFDPAQVSMAAREGNLESVVAAHECHRKWLAFLVEGEGVECKVDVCIEINVRNGVYDSMYIREAAILGATSEIMSCFFRHRRTMLNGFARPVRGRPREPTVSKQRRPLIRTLSQPIYG